MESAQSAEAGEWLGRLVLSGKCPRDHENSGRCVGHLKLFFYPWCEQYRLACEHCGEVIKSPGINLDPMPHRIAQEIAKHLETRWCERESGIWAIRQRFRAIEFRTRQVQNSMF